MIRGDGGVSGEIRIVKGGEDATRFPIFDSVNKVVIDLPVGSYIDIVGSTEDGAPRFRVYHGKKMAEVCYYDPESDQKFCNYKIFRSGVPPEKLKRLADNLSNALDLLVSSSEAARETIDNIVLRFTIAKDVSSEEFGYEVAGYTAFDSDSPTCEIVIPENWIEQLSPRMLARLISHELGHCQEAYHRRIRYLPPREGGWIIRGEEARPVGSERVAEHFSLRTMKRIP